MNARIARHPPAQFATVSADAWTAPFWQGAARRELLLPRCAACGHYRMPPTPFCPECRSQEIDWVHHDAGAVLYTYTIVERAIVPGMEDSLPYVPAIVEFPQAQGIRLITNMVDCAIARLRIGAPVKLAWIEPAPGQVLPAFTLEPDSQDQGQPS